MRVAAMEPLPIRQWTLNHRLLQQRGKRFARGTEAEQGENGLTRTDRRSGDKEMPLPPPPSPQGSSIFQSGLFGQLRSCLPGLLPSARWQRVLDGTVTTMVPGPVQWGGTDKPTSCGLANRGFPCQNELVDNTSLIITELFHYDFWHTLAWQWGFRYKELILILLISEQIVQHNDEQG